MIKFHRSSNHPGFGNLAIQLKEVRGIFLAEAVYSVCILTFVMLLAFPCLIRIYQERLLIQQKNEAMTVLRTELIQWKTDDPVAFPSSKTATPFQLNWKEKSEHQAILSVTWINKGKTYEMTSEARK
ncbi:MAG: type II secretion system protein [Sporolactobacillus sp.]